MANKFLPFIVEKSTPVHIFSTVLSRSKSMNHQLIASILNIVMSVGIAKVRTYVNTLPDMPLSSLYEKVISHYNIYSVDSSYLNCFTALSKYFSKEDRDSLCKDLSTWETVDVLIFLAVTSIHLDAKEMEQYTTLPVHKITGMRKEILSNIPYYVNFSDTGSPMVFNSPGELEAYVIYAAVVAAESNPPTRAVFEPLAGK